MIDPLPHVGSTDAFTVQQYSPFPRVDDGYGGRTQTFADFQTVWAQITPAGAREKFQAGKIEHQITHKILIRGLDGVLPSMRVKFIVGGSTTRYFQIHGVERDLEKNQWMRLLCVEGVES